MGPKKSANRFKITCLECGVEMNNGYRLKHNRLFHAQMVKQHKLIRWETLNAPKNPFEVRPAKVPRTDEVPSTSINTEMPMIQLQFLIPFPPSMRVYRFLLKKPSIHPP